MEDEPHPPRGADVLVIVPIVLGFAALAWAIAPRSLVDAWTWFPLAGGAAIAIGVPAAFWLLERGTTRLLPFVGLGALGAAVPPVALLVSASIGLLARNGTEYLGWVFRRGAPFPGYGTLPWTDFLRLVIESALIGASSGALLWLLRFRGRTTAGDPVIHAGILIGVTALALAALHMVFKP